jgi:hypothetical protein
MKNWKVVFGIVFLAIMVLVLVSCSGGISGTWRPEHTTFLPGVFSLTFSGKSFTAGGDSDFGNTGRGKYSISDGKIEFVYSDGRIKVFSFSRTENTISIGGRRFTRER